MTVTVVLDPSIALGVGDEPGLELLQEWATDHRVRLGHQTWLRLAHGYGEQSLGTPEHLGQIARRVIGDLLARSPLEHDVAHANATVHPTYLGSADHAQHLVDDITGIGDDPSAVLGTHPALWSELPSSVRCDPPPPSALRSHLEPNLPTPAEVRSVAAAWFHGRRILVVGGQVDRSVIAAIGERLGIDAALVHWVPSEKNKRARNLKKIIAALPANSLVVCIVGKVGHDVSGDVKDSCARCKIQLVETRFASQLLRDLADLVG